ncbi:Nucleic acid dioxygenase ALKBH1 [Schistosoma japonicum]|nr:Nucleic acid dioxygenase ALKBH1 [Schistosoma japonicum]
MCMAYSDDDQDIYLKNVFKFYKHLNYTHDVCKRIRTCTDLVFKEIVFNNLSNSHPNCIVQSLVTEDFFIIKNFLSSTKLEDLWQSALTEWCRLPTAQCNLDTKVSPNNRICPTDSWYSKLRWVTLGYHYQWSERAYDESKIGEFPELLSETVVSIVNFLKQLIENGEILSNNYSNLLEKCKNYNPEASIVNYYRTKTTMGFHSDDAEVDKEAPLISISIGPAALFLLETSKPIKHKFDSPLSHSSFEQAAGYDHIVPVFLHHGDVVIMAGKSRLARHAVPVIFLNDVAEVVLKGALNVSHKICDKFLRQDHDNDECIHCQEFVQYAKSTRINMNVRQVMPAHK